MLGIALNKKDFVKFCDVPMNEWLLSFAMIHLIEVLSAIILFKKIDTTQNPERIDFIIKCFNVFFLGSLKVGLTAWGSTFIYSEESK